MKILVVVPPGTMVLTMENPNIDQAFTIDLDALPKIEPFDWTFARLLGQPVYDAQRVAPWRPPEPIIIEE